MENCLGILNNSNLEANFSSLTSNRPVYMLPYGGRYRLVDVSISNMVNNGIKTVAVYTGEKIRSTMDHLGDGRAWNLNSRFQGLFLFPPVRQKDLIMRLGDLADFYSTLAFLETTKEEYVFVQDSNVIFMADLADAYKEFRDSDSDITLFYQKKTDLNGEFVNTDKLHLGDNGEVENIGINLGTEPEFNMFINTIFIKKSVLIDLVKSSVEKGNANSLKDAIIKNKNRYKIISHEIDKLVYIITNTSNYYKANMDLLDVDIFNAIFIDNGRVFTRTKDEPSTIYRNGSEIENSLIANGCEIEGAVENSLIFRGVKIEKNVIIRNSIIMQKSTLKEGSVVVNSILDKFTTIGRDVSIVGTKNQPYVAGKYESIERE